jgi:hypothetical protein
MDSATRLDDHATAEREVGLSLEYDAALPLAPNPFLLWNTFLGGSGVDEAQDVAVDVAGNIYVVGSSPVSWGAPVTPHHSNNLNDAFVAKLSRDGALLWHTFVGGSGQEDGLAIAVDGSGNTYITGTSNATFGLPIRPFAGIEDAFVVKLADSNGFCGHLR